MRDRGRRWGHGGDGSARAPVLAAALATLTVIVVPFVATGGPSGPLDTDLSPLAQRALAELPSATQFADGVVVPATTDPGVAWTGIVGEDRIEGEVVDLGVHGLVDYGYLPSSGLAPTWVEDVGRDDGVFSDVGPLSYACMRWPGAASCSGALLVRHQGVHYLLRSGLDVPGPLAAVVRFNALDLDQPTSLLLGRVPATASEVRVTVGELDVDARISRVGAVGGTTIWWASVVGQPSTVRSFDASGREIAVVDLRH